MTEAQLGKRSRLNLTGVHPELVRLLESAVDDTPIDFTVVEGARTEARQKQLYAQGRTTAGIIVTQRDGVTKRSAHQYRKAKDGNLYGFAVDLYPYKDGKVWVQEAETASLLKVITDHIKKRAKELGINIICGIDWRKPYDPPHIEYVE